jgi:hypothetical protein
MHLDVFSVEMHGIERPVPKALQGFGRESAEGTAVFVGLASAEGTTGF